MKTNIERTACRWIRRGAVRGARRKTGVAVSVWALAAALAVSLGGTAAAPVRASAQGVRSGADAPVALRSVDRNQVLPLLGISSFGCRCSVETGVDDRAQWLFETEPKVKTIVSGGPSAGKLMPGDEIVAVDGLLITTRRGGRRFSAIEAGDRVALTIRRGGRLSTESIMAAVPEGTPEVTVRGVGVDTRRRLDQLSAQIESLATVSTLAPMPPQPGSPAPVKNDRDGRGLRESTGVELRRLEVRPNAPINLKRRAMPQVQPPPEPLGGEIAPVLPRGWFGFGLSYSGTVQAGTTPGEAPRWHFDSAPKVVSVEPGGPADRAGIHAGDELVGIDGRSLTTEVGARRFSRVEPGETVEWSVRRDGRRQTVSARADERPDAKTETQRMEQLAVQLDELSDRLGASGLESPTVETDASRVRGGRTDEVRAPLRFRGTVGRASVEVRGAESIRVVEDAETGEIVIYTRDGTIRIRRGDSTRGR